jgi:hypothetical protein
MLNISRYTNERMNESLCIHTHIHTCIHRGEGHDFTCNRLVSTDCWETADHGFLASIYILQAEAPIVFVLDHFFSWVFV